MNSASLAGWGKVLSCVCGFGGLDFNFSSQIFREQERFFVYQRFDFLRFAFSYPRNTNFGLKISVNGFEELLLYPVIKILSLSFSVA